ncbi:probable inactive ATP-dependent zinc metalloprotease FTSHI 5, chloroplastic isoform X2 [Carya illinoinensis]|uniref:probable inactive ATP-dependent zinc metalloprotease FTSHI 5, chloroplastic isoform X2 n=1 Tax=Carya illinoinensis TaxID=32201 RepID=UPI001C71856C|nr:probable inactive ATP-dependent zinc metalloprotease FTSHI 5, chloroplastic isoform X2 [Carya illinoinensis]
MDAILFSLPPTNPFTSQCQPPLRTASSPSLTTKRRIRNQKSPRKATTNVFPFGSHLSSISFPGASRTSKFANPEEKSALGGCSRSNYKAPEEESVVEIFSSSNSHQPEKCLLNLIVNYGNFDKSIINRTAKTIVYALFCTAIGFSPFRGFRACAVAAPVVAKSILDRKENVKEQQSITVRSKGHEYSECTRRLLEVVSGLLRNIEEARRGNGEIKEVEEAWNAVKSKKEELQEGIMSELYVKVNQLKREKRELENRAEEIVDKVVKVKGEYERLVRKGNKEGKERMERLEESLSGLEVEYKTVWEKVGEIEDQILRTETVTMSYGVRELCFIERQSEQLVGRFIREMRNKSTHSLPKSFVPKLSKPDIQKDLASAQRKHLEQMILPSILELEDLGPLFDQESRDFAQRISEGLRDSRELQRNLEARIRKNMKKFGVEKRFVVNTPEDEVLKGFPEVELKWMFGDKEVVVPNAIGLHLFHGWKKWREEAKADLKRNLLENLEFGEQYVAERQERILLDRDRVVSKTWYDEEKNRWEMDPMAVPYAVSKKLVEHVRIRHDWAVMYILLKGDDKEYCVNIKEFDLLFEEFGGFDGLYMKMLACDIPTTVHLMWIPLSELDFRQQFLLTMRLSSQCLNGLWKSRIVSYAKNWVFEKIRNINDDIMMMVVFPTVEFIIPYPVRMRLGMAWPEEIDQAVDSTWYLKWQSEAERRFKSRKKDNMQWLLWFLVRSIIYGFVLFNVIQFMSRKIRRLLGYGPLRRNPDLWKLRRVKTYLSYRVREIKRKKKAGIDPIKTAFEGMKRVKNPPIPLKAFASIDSMREEINEVVAFLQNPRAFEQMGARAPRGVLIVGERGTGKTSLALAVAAEAKVPVVEIKAQQLEPGLWVGQSASNVRELFQTARDLVAEKTALLRPIELKLVPVALEGSAFRSKFLDPDELMSYCSWFATFSHNVPKWLRETKFVNKLSKMLVNHLGLKLTKEDMQNVVDLMEPYGQISNGIELLNPPLEWTREAKFPHAVWAAGRALIALLLPNFAVVDNVWLEPLSWQGIGCTKITKMRNEGSAMGTSESRSYLEKKLVFCFGSYIAARMLLPFGEENFLSSSELNQAQEIATRMVLQYGWGPDDSPAIYYHNNAVTALSMGDNHEFEMAAKVEKMYDLAYYKAKEMLQKNHQVLGKIVEELVEFEILTRKDLERIVEEYGGIQEKEPFFLSSSYNREPLSSGFLDGGNATGTALLRSA